MGGHHPMWLLSALVLVFLPAAYTELTPPYFNLAEGRKIAASSTCGLDIVGPELYCKLVGSHTDDQQNKTAFDVHDDSTYTSSLSRQGHVVIQGQVRFLTNESRKELMGWKNDRVGEKYFMKAILTIFSKQKKIVPLIIASSFYSPSHQYSKSKMSKTGSQPEKNLTFRKSYHRPTFLKL